MAKGGWKIFGLVVLAAAIFGWLAVQFVEDFQAAPKETAVLVGAGFVTWYLGSRLDEIHDVLRDIRDSLKDKSR